MTTCADTFRAEGEPRAVASNQPLYLDGASCAWYVESGRVEVFATAASGDAATGRIHVASFLPGSLLLSGGVGDAGGPRLVAVGVPGSSVLELPCEKLRKLTAAEESKADVARLVDEWIERITEGVVRGSSPKVTAVLKVGEESSVKAGAVVSPPRIVWLTAVKPPCLFLGKDSLSLATAGEVFPLADCGWLETAEEGKLRAVDTLQIVEDPALWLGVERFHESILCCAMSNAEDAARRERLRLGRKARAEQEQTVAAMSRLAKSIRDEKSLEADADAVEEPLLMACRLIGGRLGIRIQAPTNYHETKLVDPVQAIARASRTRLRRIILSGRWWEKENGPLLAFLRDGNRPVALLPTTKGYEVADPEAGTQEKLTEEVRRNLTGSGYMFYRSFEPRALKPHHVLRFSLFGTARDWAMLGLMGMSAALLGLFVPIATGWIFGGVVPDANYRQLILLVAALAVNAVVLAIFEFVQEMATLRIEVRMDNSVEAAVWDRLLNLPAPFFRKYSTGDLAMRAMGIGQIRQVLTQAAMSSLLTFVFSFVTFGLLFYYNVRLACIGVGLFLVVVAATVATAFIQLPIERKQYQIRGKVAGIVLQLLSGISRLRVAGAENRALAYWARHYSGQVRLAFRSQMVSNNLETFLSSVPVLSMMALFVAMVVFPTENVSLAVFLAFSAALAQVIGAAVSVGSTVSSVLGIVPLYERSKPILETLPESFSAKDDPGLLSGQIEVSHASFRYQEGGPLVLDDVSLSIRPGEFVAFVGPSGAGKSTILRLLLGFEKPEQGSIYYDNEDFAQLDRQAVRRQIGVVFQNSRLVAGDIFRNIIGSAPLTLEDAWEAARLSGLDKDIKQMPMGMHTVISEGESTLSGGQRQRLLIARAIVSRPKILFFDEATSALDNVTQARVSQSLESFKATRVVIAHRLSTIMNADRIYVVERGKIVQQGGYEELLEAPGLFADLAKRQLV